MNEGIVIVRGSLGRGSDRGPWGFDVRHNGQIVHHDATHEQATRFAEGFSAGIFAATGVIVSVEDHTTVEERVS